MKKFIIIICFNFLTSLTIAQVSNLSDLNGSPVLLKKYTEVVGSAFYKDNWIIGNVVAVNGKSFNGIFLKYDSFKDVVYFKQKINDDLFEFVDKIKSFTLIGTEGDDVFLSGFAEVDNFKKDSYYQVLADKNGNYLLKKYIKSIQETKAYNSATTEKAFIDVQVYYLFVDGKMIKIRPSKKEFLANFPSKADKINSYLKSQDVDFKSNKDLGNLFNNIMEAN